MISIRRRIRDRRNTRAFNRVLDTASPAMQQELVAAQARSQFLNR